MVLQKQKGTSSFFITRHYHDNYQHFNNDNNDDQDNDDGVATWSIGANGAAQNPLDLVEGLTVGGTVWKGMDGAAVTN